MLENVVYQQNTHFSYIDISFAHQMFPFFLMIFRSSVNDFLYAAFKSCSNFLNGYSSVISNVSVQDLHFDYNFQLLLNYTSAIRIFKKCDY
jgi:hypothetical protein